MWMSLAPSRAAWVNSALIMRITGASSWVSSRSSTSGMSCINRARSISFSAAPTTAAASPVSAYAAVSRVSSSASEIRVIRTAPWRRWISAMAHAGVRGLTVKRLPSGRMLSSARCARAQE